ncbi:MAG: hypothetical protein NZ455_09975 [Bacteroidia bacterium]|nr:hypothetical protein [Bacteroidia bacterium]MDW8345528.1 hypothetical protein [Bacteroidia bacterium]
MRRACVSTVRSTKAKRSPQHADPSAARDTPRVKKRSCPNYN